ncbi:MAG: integrase core domain-containing protein [Thermodesulfobacteriota bacterium]
MDGALSHLAAQLTEKLGLLLNSRYALENAYLRQQVKILRGKIGKRIWFTENERALLVRYGLPIKDWLADVVSIVRPETLLAWHRRMKKEKWTFDNTQKKPGRPQTPSETEHLIVKIAQENARMGYTRIAGELKKLGHCLAPTTVANILKKHGLPPSPQRKGLPWKTFIQSHLNVAWATDFFTEEVWTKTGLVTFYVLFFIHLGTRRVHIAGCTPNPDSAWMQQQARNLSMKFSDDRASCRYIIHDRDASFLPFDFIIKTDGIKIVKTPPHAPMCNAYAERFVREARETLDNIIPLGERHFRHVLRCIETHHNRQRPHQGIDNLIPEGFDYPEQPADIGDVVCDPMLGGLLNHYHVKKAA